MSKPSFRLVALALLLTVVGTSAARCDEVTESRLDTYETSDGTAYFAVSLAPNIAVPQANAHDVVILFDTSASQTSLFRDKGLSALDTLLASLQRGDSVHLMAVDLEAVPLTTGFVSPQSPEMQQAIAALKQRAPLGATDMPEVLRAAAGSFAAKSSSPKVVIYIGDGMSTAHFMAVEEYRKLVDTLVDLRISLSSYAVGPRMDSQLLASLANQTGGMLVVDDESIDPKQAGAFLASAAQGAVVWPGAVTWPKQFVEVYPQRMPPLRTDRDTIVVGRAQGAMTGEVHIAAAVRNGGKPQTLKWTLSAGDSNIDFAFLPALVEAAHADGGLRLITLGTPGLKETRRILGESAEALGKLSRQAIASGNVDTAERLADEALRRDPNDPSAAAVKKQLAKIHAGAAAVAAPEAKLEVKRFSNEQAAPPRKAAAAKFRKPVAAKALAPAAEEVPAEEVNADDVNDGEGRLLADIDAQNRLITNLIRTEVENEMRESRSRMASEPAKVEQSLKLMMQRVMQAPELKAEVRSQLRTQLETMLREANRRAATKDIIDQQIQEARAGALDRLRIAGALARDQEKVKQLMDRFNSLMDEGRYTAADQIGSVEMPAIAPNSTLTAAAALVAHETGAREANLALRNIRSKAVVDTLNTVEVSMVPFPDDQPVVYPDAAAWEELTERRKKYTHVDLKKVGAAEKKINAALLDETTMDFEETPLQDVVDYLHDYHGIEIQLDIKALEDAAVGTDTPVTRRLKGISLRSALRLVLGAMDLTYVVKDEVLLITTKERADSELVTKAYPVADLVIPIRSMSMGGMGGGMMGGMGGGGMGGGGMGGMGGGGMGGGGMGGMGGGGMGGGMFSVPDAPARASGKFQAFAVPDDLKLTPKKATANSTTTGNSATTGSSKSGAKPTNRKAPAEAVAPAKTAPQPTTASAAKPSSKVRPIELPAAAAADPEVAWNDYFSSHPDVQPDAVRETVRQLMHERKFSEVIALVQAALRTGHPQPWMYEAMSLAMQAAGSSKAQVERALMSAIDFGDGAEDFMYVAQYMARCGLESRALKIFHQVAILEPLRPEPYLYGLQLAQRLNDLQGIQWSSLGILKQAWPKERKEVVQSASRAADGAVQQLKAEKRLDEAAQFQAELDKAKIRDCMVKVAWTGDADVDIMVEEPAGTMCTFRSPRTSGGGVLLGDTPAQDSRGQGLSETYVCPEAFNGTYRVLIRRVWGKVTAGKVTVDVYAHYGTPQEKHLRHQIALGEDDALVVFDLDGGRRQEPLAEQQLANAAVGQMAVNQAILAQQLNGVSNSSAGANANFGASRQGMFAVPFIQQAVGYQPVIISLPSGTRLSVSGVVSADRRYVRITPSPFFSGVGSVTTFNIQSGTTGSSPGPGQGGTQPGQVPPGGNPGAGGGGGAA